MVGVEPLVIADAGPIIALSFIGRLELLSALFSRVLAPPAVWAEVTLDPHAPGAAHIRAATFVEVVTPEPQPLPAGMPLMGPGEVEAIMLARSFPNALVLLDERRARRAAVALGLHVSGTIGLLVRAKREGLVSLVGPLVDDMRQQGIHFSDRLVVEALKAAGERE